MMLGGDLVPEEEIRGWIRVVAATQPGPAGLTFPHGLIIPPFSIPDHITLQGAACWFPGAYTNQGVGAYGFLTPADDAFFFVQMVDAACRAKPNLQGFDALVATAWGEHVGDVNLQASVPFRAFRTLRVEQTAEVTEGGGDDAFIPASTASGERPLSEVCDRAFESVAADPATGLVVCDGAAGHTRVDWGFCDSIRKSGSCLMPSLLRWQAARRLADLHGGARRPEAERRYRAIAATIAAHLAPVFYTELGANEGMLRSATGIGAQDDVWASAFALWLGVLPRRTEAAVARHLLKLYADGSIVRQGQVRQLPDGKFWEQSSAGRGTYQNGGYWATPTGWLVVALRKVDPAAGDRLLHEYAEFVKANRAAGAPFEWVNPDLGARWNANYGSSAGLVYIAAASKGHV